MLTDGKPYIYDFESSRLINANIHPFLLHCGVHSLAFSNTCVRPYFSGWQVFKPHEEKDQEERAKVGVSNFSRRRLFSLQD